MNIDTMQEMYTLISEFVQTNEFSDNFQQIPYVPFTVCLFESFLAKSFIYDKKKVWMKNGTKVVALHVHWDGVFELVQTSREKVESLKN